MRLGGTHCGDKGARYPEWAQGNLCISSPVSFEQQSWIEPRFSVVSRTDA
jgi:hypothetical protein